MAATKKETAKKADVKVTEAAAAVTKDVEATKTETPKTPAKKEVAKKETVKKEAEKKETVKKETAKTETAKKAPVKKSEPKASVVVEYAGGQVAVKDIVARATKAFAKANKGVTVKKIEVYIKPEEGVAYYVVNGIGSDEYKVEL